MYCVRLNSIEGRNNIAICQKYDQQITDYFASIAAVKNLQCYVHITFLKTTVH